jgi:hypothetical protein
MVTPMGKMLQIVLAAISISSLSTAAILAALLYWPVEPAYAPANPPPDVASVEGNQLFVRRFFRISKDFSGTIYRELVKDGDGYLVKWELQSGYIDLAKGDTTQARAISLPSMAPGDYKLVNEVCYRVNFLREECVKLPIINIKIGDPSSTTSRGG